MVYTTMEERLEEEREAEQKEEEDTEDKECLVREDIAVMLMRCFGLIHIADRTDRNCNTGQLSVIFSSVFRIKRFGFHTAFVFIFTACDK